MAKDIHFKLEKGAPLKEEEIAMIEAASVMPDEADEENPEIDPIKTPELYAALVKAVGERNRRISGARSTNQAS